MNTFDTLFKNLKRRFSFLQNPVSTNDTITPFKDWSVLMGIMFFIGVFLIAIAAYLFVIINNTESVNVTVTDGSLDAVRTEALQNVLATFSQKEELFQTLLETPPYIIDPSL